MTLAEALLALSLALPADMLPGRVARLETIARAVAAESGGDVETAAMLWVIGSEESGGFAADVHRGTRRGDGGASICLAQIHRSNPAGRPWASLAGTGLHATRRCFAAARRTLAFARSHCEARSHRGSLLRATLAVYGTGSRDCDKWFEGSSRRARRVEAVASALRSMVR
jgi:hypothetical protein